MPGVVVSTSVRTGPTTSLVAPASTFFVAGFTKRGVPNTAGLIRSYADFLDAYGGNVSYSYVSQVVKTFFEEGGTRVYVSRMTGPSATSGTLDLDDRQGSPETCITLTAASPGSWSSDVDIEVQDVAGQLADTSRLVVRLDDAIIYTTRAHTSASAMVAEINGAAALKSVISGVAVSDLIPAVLASTALAAGDDNRTEVNADSDRVDALENFGYELGAGAVSIPGYYGTTIWDGLMAHAAEYRRIGIAAFGQTDAINVVKAEMANYYDAQYSDHMAFYYPWINIPGVVTGTLESVPPEGYAAAARARAHLDTGPWRPGAGKLSEARWVREPYVSLVKAQGDDLDAARINVIRMVANTLRIYGARSASVDETNFRFITARDTMNFIVGEAEKRLEDYVFYTIDSRGGLFGLLTGALVALLDPISKAGGLYSLEDADGNILDPGYNVVVNDILNPASQIASGLVKAKIGVRISSVGDQIELIVTKSDLTTGI